MMKCEFCGHMAHTRSSYSASNTCTERYLQCTNINCGHTFVTAETKIRSIMTPGKVMPAEPHPDKFDQQQLSLD